MSNYQASTSPVFQRLFAPVMEVYSQSEKQYDCKTISDLDFLEMGVLRCLSESKTGRDFLQRHGDNNRLAVDPRHFSKSLKSNRRIDNLDSVNRLIKPILSANIPDPYAQIPELNGFAVYSGDGHFHKGATHDRRQSTSKGGDRKPATGHFFMMNHRSHYLSHLATADVGGLRKGEHDMRVIKRSDIDLLRGNEPKGTKVIMVWDKAGIDLRYWYKVKSLFGLYFVSRVKENMKLIACGDWKFDRNDERNKGVIKDEMVGPGSGGATFRRITYRDPEKGIVYKFITTEMTLPPGIICLLYKHRWDIEKIFDQFKNKLDETKSWGSGKKSKISHALFLCLSHNLMMLLEADLIKEGIVNGNELHRKEKRLKKLIKNGGNFVATFGQRFKVRSLKFIRWLRNHIYREAPWDKAKLRLREIYDTF